jgi:sensor histidine kinase YesM
MKLINKPKYLIYSALGFVLFVIFTLTLDKIAYRAMDIKEADQYNAFVYYVAEGVICGLLAWVLSFGILYFYEKWVDFGDLQKKVVWKMILVFCVAQALYSILLWPILNAVYTYYRNKPTGVTLGMKFVNLPYFAAIFVIWIFIVTAIKLFHFLNQVKINQLQLESNLRESQLNTLKGQINPHFMFNSLNNIRGLILEDATRARDIITRLSEMLRYSLTKNDVNTISIKEELQTVDNYIEISKIQFEERLRFTMTANPDTLTVSIPPMIIQMLVENAVKHGIGNIKGGGEIYLTIEKADAELHITVKNSGSLQFNQGTTKLGLENIKKRLGLLYADKAHFTLQENGNFVEAKISIPLV